MDKIKNQYNRRSTFYASLMDSMRTRSTAQALLGVLPKQLPPGSHLLDIGSGSGLATAVLAQTYPDARLTALDFSDKLLSVLKKRLPDTDIVRADMNKQPALKSAPFHLVVSAGAVSEYGDLNIVLPWIRSLLVPGGMFINIGVDDNFLGRLTGLLWRFQPRSAATFTAACRAAGFDPVVIQIPSPNIFLKHREEYIVTATR
jgi:trans-aconitate methyltransferase